MKILVTGAGGFIGTRLIPHFRAAGHDVLPLSRGDMIAEPMALPEADAVVHLAGIAHTNGISACEYRRINCDLPVRLARAAGDSAIKRFVFVSSSHAESHLGTAYGASKAKAERLLLALDAPKIVVVRPTLVYGPGAKGNFRSLLRMATLPVPLPFGAAGRRSMVFVENLVDFLAFACVGPDLEGKVFTVADPGAPLTVGEVVGLLRSGAGRPGWLFQARWLPTAMRRLGAGRLAEKVFGDAVSDSTALARTGWKPPFSAQDALRLTGAACLSRRS